MGAWYTVKEGFSGFSRAKLAAIGSIITVTIALLLLGLFYIISTNTSRIMVGLRGKVEMEAFLQEPITQQRINAIQEEMNAVEGVERVQYISKEEAAKVFRQEFGEEVGSVLNFNPLPPSFKLYLREEFRNAQKAELISTTIKRLHGVDDVIYRREMLEFIEKQSKVLDLVGFGLGMIIGLSAIFLVSNTIRLTIYAKRKSIQTMKLVGASRWFVRAPFIIEGGIQGILGGMVAAGMIYYLLSHAVRMVSVELAEFIMVDVTFYPLLVATGIVLGLFGSSISVRKYIGETVVS